jgi:urease accessory protein
VIRVRAQRGPDRTVVAEIRGVTPWRPVQIVGSTPGATVAMVQTAACLISGDDIRIEVVVGAGAQLELIELGATIAHHVRGGSNCQLAIDVTLEPAATLVWGAAPLISAGGSRLQRIVNADLAAGAVALLRDTTVFGRNDEPGGALLSTLHVTHDGRPLLHEQLDTTDESLAGSPVVLGNAGLLDSLLLLGTRDPDCPAGTMSLAGAGAVWRQLPTESPPHLSDGDLVWERWHALVRSSATGSAHDEIEA